MVDPSCLPHLYTWEARYTKNPSLSIVPKSVGLCLSCLTSDLRKVIFTSIFLMMSTGLLQRRVPAKNAIWRSSLPITNLTPHYISQFCVSFHFCIYQKPADVYKRVQMGLKYILVHCKHLWLCLFINSWSISRYMCAGKVVIVTPTLPSHLVVHFLYGWDVGCLTQTINCMIFKLILKVPLKKIK